MRSFILTPVKTMGALNTFRGQAVGSLWVSRVQALRLSTPLRSTPQAVWESLGRFTQATGRDCTLFPTTICDISPLFSGQLSATSTGPIKTYSNLHKEIRS
jgi:hypothetical protein